MKPILFNTKMVRAILAGRKTATRRVANINPDRLCRGMDEDEHEFIWDNFIGGQATGFVCRKCGFGVSPPHSKYPCGTSVFRPRYLPGEILYVRETWCKVGDDVDRLFFDNDAALYDGMYLYKADDIDLTDIGKWHPSIFMPKEAARLFLRVTDVRVERLQEITEKQARAEGAPKAFEYNTPEGPVIYLDEDGYFFLGFKALWNSTIKKTDLPRYGWEANPWVWVIEFERISKEEAQKGGNGNG